MASTPRPEQRSYRKVFRRLWSDQDFRALTDSERVVALYVLAGPQTNRVGLFRFSLPLLAEDLGRPPRVMKRAFDHVITAFGWQFDHDQRVIFIPSWWKYNSPPKQDHNFRGALTDLGELPSTRLMSLFCQNLGDVPEPQHHLINEWLSRCTADAEPLLPDQTRPDKYTRPDVPPIPPAGGLTEVDGVRASVQHTGTPRRTRNGLQRSFSENDLRARFERFWTEYPRKVAKDASWREWLKRSPDNNLTDLMIRAIREQLASAQWLKDGGQFVPHPRTWLHQGRWEDGPEEIPHLSERTVRVMKGLQ